ncbi:potential oxidoreductase [Pseudozyma hubeiensis SY62]|uniref:Potential oxidoreductase n=1 Tax=Pseudozyma hubeiensis (strain SY62) TaxID=1305764 RepID=R9PEM4_PSEHS|nr:potential oxidoreductase [Pseudozyma hubeiensis SY62]GAC96555.1 potential oxidoreductase [Pseudozyma hubeiensis SY62]
MFEHSLILVTGANGYIASALVKKLVDHGARVRATVRREASGEQLRETLSPDAKGSLEIAIVQDITASGAFKSALQGVTHVFHAASPIPGAGKIDAKRDFIDPAVAGTMSLLEDAHATSSVVKVVLTSSIAAMLDAATIRQAGTYTSSDWNSITYDTAIALNDKLASDNPAEVAQYSMYIYAASKTLAEKAARDFVSEKKARFAFNTVHPAFVIGKPAIRDAGLNGSNAIFWKALTARPIDAGDAMHLVSLQDTVNGHVKAMESEEANGKRLILCSGEPLTAELINWAKDRGGSSLAFERVDLPHNVEELKRNVRNFDVSETERVLDIKFESVRETVDNWVDWITEERITKS